MSTRKPACAKWASGVAASRESKSDMTSDAVDFDLDLGVAIDVDDVGGTASSSSDVSCDQRRKC